MICSVFNVWFCRFFLQDDSSVKSRRASSGSGRPADGDYKFQNFPLERWQHVQRLSLTDDTRNDLWRVVGKIRETLVPVNNLNGEVTEQMMYLL
jgi:hypothetical protein